MIKRILLFIFLLILTTVAVFADEQVDVMLSNDHNEEIVTLQPQCHIFVSLAEAEGESGNLSVAIENIRDDDNVLIIFDAGYDEKLLKRQNPKITYNKIFGGTKGRRITDCNRTLSRTIRVSPSDDKKILLSKVVRADESLTVRLPLYIAKYKGRNYRQLELMEKHVVELNISVRLKPDENFLRLTAAIDDYIARLEERPFCTHKRHKVSLENQKKPYEKERKQMLERIDSIKRANNWYTTDREYKKYDSLRKVLTNLRMSDYETPNCNISRLHKHSPKIDNRSASRHSCKYCGWSLAQISHKLEDYYKQLYARKTTKSAIIADVRALYNCCANDDCKKHASAWRNDGKDKDRIVKYYNRINSF